MLNIAFIFSKDLFVASHLFYEIMRAYTKSPYNLKASFNSESNKLNHLM